MGHILHGSARTTPQTRRELQNSKKNVKELALTYNITKKYYIYVGICRISKFVFVRVYTRQTADNAVAFLEPTTKLMELANFSTFWLQNTTFLLKYGKYSYTQSCIFRSKIEKNYLRLRVLL